MKILFIETWKTTCFAGGNVLLAMPEINIFKNCGGVAIKSA
jgi:hypothetical protein